MKAQILALVVEKTGYPADMLDPDLDLEADLGVDTVKQAELMAAIRGIYDIPRDDRLKLRDFPTLNHVIQFVYDKRPDLKAREPAPVAAGVTRASDPSSAAHVVSGPDERPTSSTIDERPGSATNKEEPTTIADPVKAQILALVVEKTGYPAEMLDPELDLEADLGVDTVKQAELMAAIRGIYDIPRDDRLKLRDFPTLNHVIDFVYDRRPDLRNRESAVARGLSPAGVREPEAAVTPAGGTSAAPAAHAPAGQPPDLAGTLAAGEPAPAASGVTVSARPIAAAERRPTIAVPAPKPLSFDAANLVPRRVPKPVMRPSLDFCKRTGVSLDAGRRVIVMADQGGVGETLATRLVAIGVVPLVVTESLPDEAFDALLGDWLSAGPVSGVYWLPALDPDNMREMTFEAWRNATRTRVKLLYRTMRRLYDRMDQDDAFLVAATRSGGMHGYGDDGSRSALGGGVAGFTKAFKRERPKATVKVVDFDSPNADEIVAALVGETLRDPGVVEVGYGRGARWTIGLVEQAAVDGQPGLALSKDSVFVVTGAAGSIVSAIVTDLAAASGGVFYLFDRVPEPDPANPDLARFASDKEGLKRDVAARLKARGERATPVMVEHELAAIERSYAALQAVRAVESCGGLAIYTSVDLTDPVAVGRAIETVREQNGRVDVLVHAAGIEISRFLGEKEPAEFERVFDVKADGWFNLLTAIGDMPLNAAIAFSSIAGRFGNGGQTDYSAANDLMCKSVLNFPVTGRGTRGIAIDWTAWSGIGMASRGSIPKMMELAGIDMLPPEAGVPIVRRELTQGGTRGEVVIANRLGVMLEEFDAVGIDNETECVRARVSASGPMVGTIEKMTPSAGLVVDTTLDPGEQPFLFDHQIDGIPVLPGVMGIEAFAELARLLLPDYRIVSVEDVHFHSAFKFFRHEPRSLRLQATFTPNGGTIVARCRLVGSRTVPAHAEPQETVHFSGRVRLSTEPRAIEHEQPPVQEVERLVGAHDIYRVYFHGPAFQVVDSAWRRDGTAVGRFASNLPPAHVPAAAPLLMAPRLIELCLQTAGLWDLGLNGRLSLPHRIDRVVTFDPVEPPDTPLYAIARPASGDRGFDADVVDGLGRVYVRLRGYRTVEMPGGFDDSALRPLQLAMHGDDSGLGMALAAQVK